MKSQTTFPIAVATKLIRSTVLVISLTTVVTACTAIHPVTLVYLPPSGNPVGDYESKAALGSWLAWHEGGTLEIQAPEIFGKHGEPTHYLCAPAGDHKWSCKGNEGIQIEYIQTPKSISINRVSDGESKDIDLKAGMFLVTFPKDGKYGMASGKRMWFTAVTQADKVYKGILLWHSPPL